jgi:hypothetical protein
MSRSPRPTVLAISASAYRLLLRAYPTTFRLEFGDAMTQLFRDQATAAWRSAGATGICLVWVRTIADLCLSIAQLYSDERSRPMFKAAAVIGALYACALVGALGYSAVRFGEFYERPAFSNAGAEQPVEEDAAVAAYEQALGGEFGRYRSFARLSMITVTALLGIGAGLFGLSQKSVVHGAVAFLGGAVVAVIVLSRLPTIWFPLDRYPVAALWVFGGFPLMALALAAAVMAAGRLATRVHPRTPSAAC